MEKQEGHPKSELGPAYEKGSLRDERCDDDSNPDDDSDSDLRNSLTDVTQQNTDSGEGTHSKRNDDEIKEIVDLIRNETNFLCVWRLIMLLLILATYVLVITGAYLYLQNVQNVSTDQSVSVKPIILRMISRLTTTS